MAREKSGPSGKFGLKAFESIRELVDTFSFFLEKAIRKHGLTPSQFYLLRKIKEAGPTCQKRLGEMLAHTGGNITVVCKLLEKRKLIKRTVDSRDRRMFKVSLTTLGEKAFAECEADYKKTLEGMMSVMSEEEMERSWIITSSILEKLAAERVEAIRAYRPPTKDKKKKR